MLKKKKETFPQALSLVTLLPYPSKDSNTPQLVWLGLICCIILKDVRTENIVYELLVKEDRKKKNHSKMFIAVMML